MTAPAFCEPFFHVVHSIHPVMEDFFVAGVFSLATDAEAFAERLRADARYRNTAVVRPMPMPHIIDLLVKNRLGEVAKAIAPLVKAAAQNMDYVHLGEVLSGN